MNINGYTDLNQMMQLQRQRFDEVNIPEQGEIELSPSNEAKADYLKNQIVDQATDRIEDEREQQKEDLRHLTVGAIGYEHVNDMADAYIDMIENNTVEESEQNNNVNPYQMSAEYMQDNLQTNLYDTIEQLNNRDEGNYLYELQAELSNKFMTIQPVEEKYQVNVAI